jgi:hypothetical protein
MSATPSLPEKVVAIDRTLAEIPHAFGGALALAYYAEPRATIDIDLNVFVPVADAPGVIERLRGLGVEGDPSEDALARDGQVRLWWDRNPVDLFFSYDPFHDAARDAARRVPFADTEIPVLAADHLAVCKAVFDRPKDWVDIDAMLAAGAPIDAAEVLRWVARITGPDDPRFARIARVLAGSGGGSANA